MRLGMINRKIEKKKVCLGNNSRDGWCGTSLRHLSATELCHHLLVLKGGTVLQLVLALFAVLFPELCHHVLVLEGHEVYLEDDTVCHGRLVLVCCVGIWVC